MAKPSGWSDWNDEERAEWLFHSPEWSIESDLDDLPEADATRLRGLIEQKWNGLVDDERVDLLIKGGQWMREGMRARVTPEDAARLEELANSRWGSMSDEEKIALLTDQVNVGARETVLKQREPDADRRQQLLQAANDRANERMWRQEAAWMRNHPGRHEDLDSRGRIRLPGSDALWRSRLARARLYRWWRTRQDEARLQEILNADSQKFTDLTGPDLSALPDLDGDNLDFEWDLDEFHVEETGASDLFTVISTVVRSDLLRDDREKRLWTEPAHWEGIDRFLEVRGLLRDRYGDRLRFLLPTPRSEFYLLGDSSTASDTSTLINLPDLAGERLAFISSYEYDAPLGPMRGDLHIRCGDRLVYRDLSEPRSPAVFYLQHLEGLLRRRYGERFGSLTHAAKDDDVIYGGLPALHGDKLEFEWNFTTGPDYVRTAVVLHAGTQIWRYPRDEVIMGERQIESLLRARYGDQVASITRRSDDVVDDLLSTPADGITDAEHLVARTAERDDRMRAAVKTGTSRSDTASLHAENRTDLDRLQQLLRETRFKEPRPTSSDDVTQSIDKAPGGSSDALGAEQPNDLGDDLLSAPADKITDAQRLVARIAERDDRMRAGVQTGASKSDIGSLYTSNDTDLLRLRQLLRHPGGYTYWTTDTDAPYRTDDFGAGALFSSDDDAWMMAWCPWEELSDSSAEAIAKRIGRGRLTEPTRGGMPPRGPKEHSYAPDPPDWMQEDDEATGPTRGARRLLRRLRRRR